MIYRWPAAALGQLGRTAEAKEALDKAVSLAPAAFDMYIRKRVPWFRPEDHAHLSRDCARPDGRADAARVLASDRRGQLLKAFFRTADRGFESRSSSGAARRQRVGQRNQV